jgi:maspardin
MFSIMPEFMLKRIILGNFPTANLEVEIANSVDFMVEQLEALTQSELAGRLTLNCALGPLKPGSVVLASEHITVLDTLDDIALPDNLREEVYKFYPDARVALLKTGGNFAYLSRADEVNMHIQIHLRRHGLPFHVEDLPSTITPTNKSEARKSTTVNGGRSSTNKNDTQTDNTGNSNASTNKKLDNEYPDKNRAATTNSNSVAETSTQDDLDKAVYDDL